MTESTHQHRPVLRRIRILIDLLRDLLTQPRLLSKPLASQPSNGMPSNLNGPQFPVDISLAGRYHVRLVAEAEGLFEHDLCLQRSLFAFFKTFFSGYRVRFRTCAGCDGVGCLQVSTYLAARRGALLLCYCFCLCHLRFIV